VARDQEEAHALQRRVGVRGNSRAGGFVFAEPGREVDYWN
jgi:hypothetical protein